MASVVGTCVLLLAIVPVSAASFVKVDCTSENLGQYGQDSVLRCGINPTEEASDAMITYVKWKKTGENKTLVVFGKDHPNEPRFRFSVESLTGTSRDVSLLVSNTQINDGGEYECTVKTDSGSKDTIKTNLSVTAKYSAPVIIAEKDTDTSLICNSEDGYPKGTIQWFDQEGKNHTSISQQEEPKPMDDKRFNALTSKLTLKNSASSQYTCQVYNANGVKEGETTFNLSSKSYEGVHKMVQYGKVAASNIVAPVVVIGSLIVGLLIVLLWRKRQSGGHTPIDQDEEKANWQGGEAAAGGKKCEHSEETNTLEEERCQAMILLSAAPTN